jgi:hypothetical protein
MAITLSDAEATIESSGFLRGASTSKVIEFKSKNNGRVLYLRVGQGFPKHADIAVHPETDLTSMLGIQDVKAHKNVFRYSSNMSQFPERLNTGQKPENYGKALHVSTVEAMAKLCMAYGHSI